MGLIAIAANPASGRDIRRLVSHASVYSNREKSNIVERIILAAYQMGGHKVVIMPDSYSFGPLIKQNLEEQAQAVAKGTVILPDLPMTDSPADTTEFARHVESLGAAVLVVVGGDGTSRAAAKSETTTPMISLSTGTNNVYPEMIEGTVVGMAAAAIADGAAAREQACERSKRIEILRDGAMADIALVDAVLSGLAYGGAKAIWQRDDIQRVMVTQCHPASIGFSSVVASTFIVGADDDHGAVADCAAGDTNVRAALAAGVIAPFRLERLEIVPLDQTLTWTMTEAGMLALDGEREVRLERGESVGMRITRNGPMKVDVRRTLETAHANGYFAQPARG